MKKQTDPQHLWTYFAKEWRPLLITTVTGVVYNAGLVLIPWFEGQLAQGLLDVLAARTGAAAVLWMAGLYLLTGLLNQGLRCLKRLYVRKFSNNVNLDMKERLFRNLVHSGTPRTERRHAPKETTGSWMTKAISDVDAATEGMRKFTTEVFDTGVVMVAYAVMLLVYDWRLALIVLLFPPMAALLAEKLKKQVVKAASAAKESAGVLNGALVDRVQNAVTYRVYGAETCRNGLLEKNLTDYEKKSVGANIRENAMTPVYRVISMISAIFILWLGGRNVLGVGWRLWDIAAFSTFLSCFGKLALKASKAAKLLNTVQKAQVSWERIKPRLTDVPERRMEDAPAAEEIRAEGLGFVYPDGSRILTDLSFALCPGEMIGVTGEVASGKSTLGRIFLREAPYEGSLLFGERELRDLPADLALTSYVGHNPELFSDSLRENIMLTEGEKTPEEEASLRKVLADVSFTDELNGLPEGLDTKIGAAGVRLSGGQQARVALARALYHKRPVVVLDDPFSALDKRTEEEIFTVLRRELKDSAVLLISHRLSLFDRLDKVLFLENGHAVFSTHERLMAENEAYRRLVELQSAGGDLDE